MLHELAAVIGEDERDGEREHLEAEEEELLGGKGCVRGGLPGEAEAGVQILERDHVVSPAPDVSLDGVESHAVAWILCLKILRFPQDMSPLDWLENAEVGNLRWTHPQAPEVADEAAYGFGLGTVELLLKTKPVQFRVELLLAEVWVGKAKAFDLSNHLIWPQALPLDPRGSAFRIERLGNLSSRYPPPLPIKERAPLHLEGLESCLKTILLCEGEDFCLPQGFLGNHIPVA